MADPITTAAEVLWVSGPLRIQRRYSSTRGLVGDWHGIALIPPLALASLIIVGTGSFLVGAFGIGYVNVYSESLLLMGALVALGAFSGQLGLVGLACFALGDFLLYHRSWSTPFGSYPLYEELIRARFPLIISYLLLAVAVIVIPRLGKNITLGIGLWRRIPADLAWLLATPIVVLVSWLGLRSWAALAPTLMRPFFVWLGSAPTVESIQVFQRDTSQLVSAGVAATVVRQALVGLFIYVPPLAARLARLELRAHRRIAGGEPLTPPRPPSPASRLFADVAAAFVATLVLSGIAETRRLWFILFALFLTVRMLRSGTIRFGLLERWKVHASRVPVVLRLGFAWLGVVAYRSLLTDEVVNSYQRMSFIVLIGVAVTFLVFPGQPWPKASPEESRIPEPAL